MNGLNDKLIKNKLFEKGDLILVVGAGVSGEAAALLAAKLGGKVRVLEQKSTAITDKFSALAKEFGIEIQVGEHKPEHFENAVLAVLSPGIHPEKIENFLKGKSKSQKDIPLMAELEFASLFTDTPMIAITGTSGKTTTASLMAAMLKEADKKVFLGGNIGTPLSEYILSEKEADVLVLEVSSFQLMTCQTFHPQVGILLNLGLNHLDWHNDMQEYQDAKFKLFSKQNANDLALINTELKQETAQYNLQAQVKFVDSKTLQPRFKKTNLLGEHNRLNEEFAFWAVEFFGVSEACAALAVEKFQALENRLEPVIEKDGVLYVNDSKSTTAASLGVALETFANLSVKRPVILLAGGKFKGGDLKGLSTLIKQTVKNVILFGDSRKVFEEAWSDLTDISWFPDMEIAFKKVKEVAQSGDVVLLSPATASYDLYKDYTKRGEHFRLLAKGI
ncbi:UDP-N-acetylmuramoyl-L-alanine--D-glutamate ligase [Desulfovibrio litoralis]|uniref:UDP-N-acetylmuramoylalanine--D-glutamate ligase n=1 Tax=Desulfovibrio litoralis DSM 11393 TaxID=1121455 RepID=A0A1M7SLR2_9BACT|nr:UDP-N-acetylmuramoyl-L-alanine--D-glutamate ligase [Desulfovibrio litoralis]SHN59356.1 UDP-N-acetylmuramoylalanine--D-glutamate ligase [Desulfovibrio litoralis DSM 11393]